MRDTCLCTCCSVVEDWDSLKTASGKSTEIYIPCANLDANARRDIHQARRNASNGDDGCSVVYHVVKCDWLLDSISNYSVMDRNHPSFNV